MSCMIVNEILLTIALVIGILHYTIKLYNDMAYKVKKFVRRDSYSFYNDPLYHKFISLLNELDDIEARKKELRDAPNKLCNQSCTTRQRFLVKLYEENAQILVHIQSSLLLELQDTFFKLRKKYEKRYSKIKRRYNLADEEVTWAPKLVQYG